MALEPGTAADWANVAVTALTFLVALMLFRAGLQDRIRATEDREGRVADRGVARPRGRM
jgi:hypothetical protein